MSLKHQTQSIKHH